jgi:hypothetical protein
LAIQLQWIPPTANTGCASITVLTLSMMLVAEAFSIWQATLVTKLQSMTLYNMYQGLNNPFIPQVHYNDISVLSGEDGETPDLKGGYFVNHPVLDGQYYYICLFILLE